MYEWNFILFLFIFYFLYFYIQENINYNTHVNKRKRLKHGQTRTHKQTTQYNTYQPRPLQDTSDIARGMGLLRKQSIKINIIN